MILLTVALKVERITRGLYAHHNLRKNHDQARSEAIAAGLARYTREKPCKACGGVEFYTQPKKSGGACVACKGKLNASNPNRETPKKGARLEAHQAGLKRYDRETPCKKCGRFEFYTNKDNCCHCANEMTKAAQKRKWKAWKAFRDPKVAELWKQFKQLWAAKDPAVTPPD